jgi:aldose 1-epimerase
MVAPSGEQFRIAADGYEAVITESGGALRTLTFAGRDLVDGFHEDAMSSAGRGQLLMPWPNRIRDGRYSFDGASNQLALTEPARRNASHGLARWAGWSLVERSASAATLGYRVMAQSGYPWTLDLRVTYEVGPTGLSVTQSATNLSSRTAPYAQGAHPYLTVGAGPIDAWTLTLPASTRLLTDDERLLPIGRESVEGTSYDFRAARPIGDVAFNHCFNDLSRTGRRAIARLSDGEHSTSLWVDESWPWLLLYSADDTTTPRQSLAVEPMSAPVDAFNSGEDLIRLEPGATHSGSWGIYAG